MSLSAAQVHALAVGPQGPQAPQPRPNDKRFNQPGYDIVAFAVDFLNAIGAPITPSNVGAVVAWANIESSGYNPGVAGGLNNPLNIVVTPGDGHSGQGGSQGDIADFPSPAVAIDAYKRFWLPKTGIVTALRSDAGIPAISGVVNAFYGQWGSGISFGGASPINPGSGLPTAGGGTGGSGGGGGGGTNPFNALFAAGGALASSPLGTLLGPIVNLPGISGLTAPAKILVGIFNNWPYVLEVILGLLLFGAGAIIIMADTKIVRTAAPAAVAAA